jgi:TATA-box binding protein (TBP) (component of TFIID and TFIIIB)
MKDDINNVEDFRADFKTFRRDSSDRGGGVFFCVKNIIASTELCIDVNFEMIAVEEEELVLNYTWEIIGIYRAPNENMLAIERSATRTLLREI